MSDEKDDKWEMPTPVFRSSTGSLPRSLEETISRSFIPNAETIEIDEDVDILSIMDTPSDYQAEKKAGYFDDEAITLTPDVKPEAEVSEEPSTAATDSPQPVVVTAKYPIEIAAAKSGSLSNIFIFVLIALVAVGIIAAVLYYNSQF